MQVLRLINDMLNQPRLFNVPQTDLKLFLKAALNSIKRRSLIFVISDFISSPGWESTLSLLGQRHEVIAVRLVDPVEMILPDVGIMVMQDAETGEQMYVDTHDEKFRQRFESMMHEREENLKQAFKRAGVDSLTLSTEDDMVRAIVRFARQRQQLRKVH